MAEESTESCRRERCFTFDEYKEEFQTGRAREHGRGEVTPDTEDDATDMADQTIRIFRSALREHS